ncbi:unnamed protein product [Rhizoctonia solani]|uniref:G2/mitotic-specific cyclin cdc13 n=1 Tax=Rhizoctonia solani TaxID=456999 RepID=A0A8H3BJZ0_9AGAM|nr:unnamed protein product [Rhizoctonia solani]
MSFPLDDSMDIDPQNDGSQPGSQSNEDVPFDVAGFNSAVLGAIEQYRSSCTAVLPPFDSKDELPPDDHILLYLVIRTFLRGTEMDVNMYKDYLWQNRPLLSALQTAYTSHNFASLLSHAAMPDDVKEHAPRQEQGGQDITPSTSGNGLQDQEDSKAYSFWVLFKAHYIGNTAKLLIETLNHEREMYLQNTAIDNPYNWSISVVQSSGMGKSRTVEEAGKTVFTFPINIREGGEQEKKAYPPPDSSVRQFFEERVNSNDETQQADYMTLLSVMFSRALALVNKHFPGLTGADLALVWANYLAEGETDLQPGHRRQQFYKMVVKRATKKISNRVKIEIDKLECSLKMSCNSLAKRIQPGSVSTNACFVYIDEAHLLTQAIKSGNEEHKRNQFHNLGKVLSTLIDYPMFFIFLSTNSSLRDLAPPASHYRSERAILGSQLIPPFTELPIDIYEDKVIDEFGSMTLRNACTVDVMVCFGRPLWYTIHKVDPNSDIFKYAMNKLSNNGKPGHEANSILAALGVRVGVAFDGKEITPGDEAVFLEEKQDEEKTGVDEKRIAVEQQHSYRTQSKLVESHMRVAFAIPQHRGYMHTGAPSEPVLAEAAGRYLSSGKLGGIMAEGPKRLSEALKTGLLARGECGELVARLLVTAAHDIALRDVNNGPLRPMSNQPSYHRPILVLDFLRALFHQDHHTKILDSNSITRRPGTKSLSEAFRNSFVFFSHFALAGDSKMLSAHLLATALLRGVALQAKEGQESIDAVIPIHMGSLDDPVSAKRTSAINLQIKNRKGLSRCKIDRSITVPDVDMPVISIILELGVTGKKSNTLWVPEGCGKDPRDKHKIRPDDRHYQIVSRGCSSKLFRPVTSDVEGQYRVMLGVGTVLQDFARCDRKNNVEALRAQKSVLDGNRQENSYYPKKPKLNPTGQVSS